MSNDQEKDFTKEVSLVDFFLYYYDNFIRLLVYILIPLLIGTGIIFYFLPFTEKKDNLFTVDILIQDPSIINELKENFIFSAHNLSKAIEKSNLSDDIIVDNALLKSFSIVSGHSEFNSLVDDYIESDLNKLTQNLYFKPEQIDNFIKNLVSKGNDFKVLVFNRNNLDINNTEVSLLMTNLISVINEEISLIKDSVNIELKTIPDLIIGSPLTSVDVNRINNRLILVRQYINILQNNYLRYAPEINLLVLLSDLASDEDLFNYMVQENDIYLDLIAKRLELDIAAINKQSQVVRDNLKLLDNNYSDSLVNENSIMQADSSFIDTILSLGEKVSNQSIKSDYISQITTLQNNRISLERRSKDLNLKTDFEISEKQAQNYLINSLNNASRNINNYIEIIEETKRHKESIFALSTTHHAIEPSNFNILYSILIGSMLFGFSIITIRFLREKLIIR